MAARPKPSPAALALAALLPALVGLGAAPSRADPAPHGAGIAVLASDVGHGMAVDDLLAFVEEARVRDVIVDWAWITLHWERTDFAAVEALVSALEERGVRVAAMYRPRFKPHEVAKYDVAYQVDASGEPLNGACEIRYADAAARAWGTSWAVEILRRCPAFDEVIVYNPSQRCRSAEVVAAREKDPAFDQACVRTFLVETREAMRGVAKGARLGLVLPPDLALFEPHLDAVDVVHPFVFVREGTDFAANWDEAVEVLEASGKAGAALAKITWGEGETVTDDQLADFVATARAHHRPYVFWTFSTAFCEGHYDLDRLCAALGLDATRIRGCIRDLGGRSGLPSDPQVVAKAVREAADDTTAQAYPHMLEVASRYGEAAIEPLCRLLDDRTETPHVRWRAAGALGRIGAPAALPALLRASRDDEPYVRWLCAEALGRCGAGSAQARERLAAMAASDPAWRADAKTGERVHYVRDAARDALEQFERDAPLDAETLARTVAVVAVKDFLRLETTGPAVERVSFPRYFPAVDDDQVVLGRWVSARTDDGDPIPVVVLEVEPDPAGNLIHTFRVERVPADTGVVVTVTSVVLRRERPPPQGPCPIPKPTAYPAAVRPFLRSTPCVVVDHPRIRAVAAEIRAATDDAYEVAAAIAARQRANTYAQRADRDPGLPTSVAVLEYGGSCCGSAVAAAALFRACGIPAQITYLPAGYIHGIVQFYVAGYGWCRMDATSGVGRLPLVVKRGDRGLVRLYDMPIEMEELPHAYAWPFQHNTVTGDYEFHVGDRAVPSVRFAARDEAEARREGRVSGHVAEPFPHLEPGSWHELVDVEDWSFRDTAWKRLVTASRRAVRARDVGWFEEVARLLKPHAGPAWTEAIETRLREHGPLAPPR